MNSTETHCSVRRLAGVQNYLHPSRFQLFPTTWLYPMPLTSLPLKSLIQIDSPRLTGIVEPPNITLTNPVNTHQVFIFQDTIHTRCIFFDVVYVAALRDYACAAGHSPSQDGLDIRTISAFSDCGNVRVVEDGPMALIDVACIQGV